MASHPLPRLTEDQYLALERAAEFRSEFYDGRMHARSGGSYRHAMIILNLGTRLNLAFERRQCNVTASDVRVRVSPGRMYVYPDVAVVCGEPRFVDGKKDTLLNPAVIVEVLSPSTEADDRGLKFVHYRTLESLQEYALVSQMEPRVELYRRQPSREWLLSESVGLDSEARFETGGETIRIPLADIYGKVTFDTPPEPPQ
ncbi:MAG: Uma2 family endonuclease [Acidobacteriota bacterium]